ncbi:hypothetical protein [Streptosporangium roseum]|uniref:hypothetical protein n=1 Tax=Streptosporangium roseum TaxID=2001 RepID=UPI0009E023A1|nr:hypothetical protein [Streptosporangium roseum]
MARLNPLGHAHLNCLGRYAIASSAPEKGLRPLREAAVPKPGAATREAVVVDEDGVRVADHNDDRVRLCLIAVLRAVRARPDDQGTAAKHSPGTASARPRMTPWLKPTRSARIAVYRHCA